jgi:hypothetical protein
MSSPNDNTSPHARANYDNPVARRRQLSSGPLARHQKAFSYERGTKTTIDPRNN